MIEIKTGHREWDEFWPIVKGFIEKNRVEIEKDGSLVKGYHSPDCPWLWFRDCIHYMLVTRYIDPEIQSSIDLMLATQLDDGSFMDFLRQDGSMLRVPTEADVEYLAVIGVHRAWLATGDDEWMKSCLPKLEKGLDYMTSHPWRWDPVNRMPKRAYTIDTWDFDIREDLTEIHWPGKIDDKTHFGIMHGDVSGLYNAWKLMESMLSHIGDKEKAKDYELKHRDLRERANGLLWNGKFYRHRLSLDDFRVDGVNEDEQLSLSNSHNLNRGLPTPDMARSIIQEYQRRREQGKAFAEWFSIDPPFPTGVFGDDKLKPGVYVNGGIMPLVGGELSRGAFRFGYPEYGVDILRRYFKMIDTTGEAYLWYFPDGRPATKEESTSPEAYATDSWGSSAMAAALIQGLAGVRSGKPGFTATWLEPHWDSAGIHNAEVTLQYPASGKSFHYVYQHDPDSKTTILEVDADPLIALHVGLPDDVSGIEAEASGKKIDVEVEDWELGKGFAFCDDITGVLMIRYTRH